MLLIQTIDIKAVMDQRFAPQRRLWLLHSALMDAFPVEFKATRVDLFPDALAEITGK